MPDHGRADRSQSQEHPDIRLTDFVILPQGVAWYPNQLNVGIKHWTADFLKHVEGHSRFVLRLEYHIEEIMLQMRSEKQQERKHHNEVAGNVALLKLCGYVFSVAKWWVVRD